MDGGGGRRYGDDVCSEASEAEGGGVLQSRQDDLTRRRHVDLVRVSSALCRPGVRV
ncbi:putative leader peptide [Streptomyces odonnellii]|uniref:putative leader peptide n=1 Tax=Streptomyces odonnellii TaxID=1417980 RepID=UPI000A5E9909